MQAELETAELRLRSHANCSHLNSEICNTSKRHTDTELQSSKSSLTAIIISTYHSYVKHQKFHSTHTAHKFTYQTDLIINSLSETLRGYVYIKHPYNIIRRPVTITQE
jgi:hypothetical protein